VASALDAAHVAGLVHRDVKPGNVLVDASPGRPDHVYLSDFGLSKDTSQSAPLSEAGQFLGTPNYSAPEQIAARGVDGRADQYALACVAFTLLAGTAPFKRDDTVAVLWAHQSEPPPLLAALRPDLPPRADQVLARALAKAPEDRYDNCRDFADALRDVLGADLTAPGRQVLRGDRPEGRASEADPPTAPPSSCRRGRPCGNPGGRGGSDWQHERLRMALFGRPRDGERRQRLRRRQRRLRLELPASRQPGH